MLNRRKFGVLLGALPLFSLAPWASAKAEPKTHQVLIKQFLFEPAELTIKAGDSVEWVNKDFVPHTATEMEEALWDTEGLEQGDRGLITFTEAGSYDYFCVYHPIMLGKLTVEAG